MRSPGSEPARFAGPWSLFAWSLAVNPASAVALAAALFGLLACELGVPWLLAEAIDAALVRGDAAALDRIGLAIVGVVAGLYVVHVAYLRAETGLLYGALYRLRRLLYSRILAQPLDFFAHAKGGELTHLVINDTEVLDNHGVYVFSDLPFAVATAGAVLALMLVLDWRLGLVVVAFLAAATAMSFRLGRPLPTLRRTIQQVAGRLSGRLAEAVSGVRTVKAFGCEAAEASRLDALNAEVVSLELREGKLGSWVEPLLELMELLGVALIVWYGAHRVIDGALTPGLLVAFIAYMELLSEPVSRVGKFVRHVQACRGVMQRIVHFLDGLAPASDPQEGLAPGGERAVSFEAVSYTYPGANAPALRDVTFTAKPGQLIALVGRNGAGKSTLVELLLGFRNVQSGAVRIAGAAIETWAPRALRETAGLLPQDVFLFHTSLTENIAYGRPEASQAAIDRVVKDAGLAPLIARLPQGLDTIVGDRGQRLSGGERQRVALARTLLASPDVLVLDEPTAALDGEASRDIGSVVRDLSASRTVLVVAHRIETVAFADRVLLLDSGRLVFDGAPQDAEAQPVFRSLFGSAPERAKARESALKVARSS